jgi:prevent-host-death family protein
MQVDIAEAGSRLPELIQKVREGNPVVITQDGKPLAELTPTPADPKERPKPQFGAMRGQIKLNPGWDAPITEEQFFSGDF